MQLSPKDMVRFLRDSGYRNKDIAHKLGVSVDAASRLARGAKPALETRNALLAVYVEEVERQATLSRRINATKEANHA